MITVILDETDEFDEHVIDYIVHKLGWVRQQPEPTEDSDGP